MDEQKKHATKESIPHGVNNQLFFPLEALQMPVNLDIHAIPNRVIKERQFRTSREKLKPLKKMVSIWKRYYCSIAISFESRASFTLKRSQKLMSPKI